MWDACEGWRTTSESQFSSVVWFLGIELGRSALIASVHLSRPASLSL